MRARMFVIVLALACTSSMCGFATVIPPKAVGQPYSHSASTLPVSTNNSPRPKVDFHAEVKPIMQARCQPCHFQGGTMYTKLPFDRPETIRTLGERLFTRIRQENDRRVIRDFLSQPAANQ